MKLAHRPRDPLAFGDHQARDFRSIVAAQDEAARLLAGLRQVDFLDRSDFRFKSSFAAVNGLALAAVSTPSARLLFADRIDPAFVFPFVGKSDFRAGRKAMRMQSNINAFFVPPGLDTESSGLDRSVAVARINSHRLESTARVMLGLNFHESLVARLAQLTEMPLHHGKISFDSVFRHLFAQIDSYQGNQAMLIASGIDDTLYRTLSMALLPDAFASQKETPSTNRGRQIKAVCDYVMENIGGRVTLTDLERIGHMSRRTLHNAFYKAFGLSPVEWVRGQRLMKAQSLLSNPRNFQSVTEVLYACGFTHASLFSAQYKHRFGEMPSETLQQSQSRR